MRIEIHYGGHYKTHAHLINGQIVGCLVYLDDPRIPPNGEDIKYDCPIRGFRLSASHIRCLERAIADGKSSVEINDITLEIVPCE